VSSLKGHLGHTLAACGAIESIASIEMMRQGVLIKTRNLDEIDESCAQVMHLQENRSERPNVILSNNFAFGGMNTSLILSSVRDPI
jgi:3-oxoacyl-[acyl-carrier-protein] synthase II